MNDVEDLERRVSELERRMEILFSKTGALDMEDLGRDTTDPSPEVVELVRQEKIPKAVKLYQEETGADMAETMGALGKLRQN